jgi:hypothetical protein
VGVDLGGSKRCMAEKLLHLAQFGPVVEHMRGE